MTCSSKSTGSSRGVCTRKRLRPCARSALQSVVTLKPRRAPRRPQPEEVDRKGVAVDGEVLRGGLAVVTYPDGAERVDPGYPGWTRVGRAADADGPAPDRFLGLLYRLVVFSLSFCNSRQIDFPIHYRASFSRESQNRNTY